MFIIEKGIPFPARGSKYPFADMEVGDSFLAPDTKIASVYNAAHAYAHKHKVSLRVRATPEGVRVWRIED